MLWLTFARLKTCVVESKSIALLPKQFIALLPKETIALLPKQTIALLPKQTLKLDPDDKEGFTKHAAAHFWPSQHIR